MVRKIRRLASVVAPIAGLFLCLAVPAAPVFALDASYQADLSSVAHTLATRANVMGRGAATATLSGRVLAITGSYAGLASAATAAHLAMGLAAGVPGDAIADLAVTGGDSGRITGTVTLTAAQIAALRAGGLHVVIDSVKAPDGTLWGWLLPPATSP